MKNLVVFLLFSACTIVAHAETINVNFNQYNIVSYGSGWRSSQDIDSDQYEIQDNGATLKLWGNNWKAINLPVSVSSSQDKLLTFYFKSTGQQAEINAIGLDTNLRASRNYLFQVYGTQSYGKQDFKNYAGNDWKYYEIPLHQFFNRNFSYITFLNDADANQATEVYFKDVRITDPLQSCTDNDGDLFAVEGGECGPIDCNDNNDAIYPGAADDVCDGIDNNCNNITDEEYVATVTNCGIGACASSGLLECIDGVEIDTCASDLDDNCNGLDENCNGIPDDNFVTTNTSCGVGVCAATGTLTCSAGVETDTCTPGSPTGLDDNCNGIDEDCDGTADNNFSPYSSTCGVGLCLASGQVTCQAGVEDDTCIPGTPISEICSNGIDEDCNGTDLTCPPCGDGLITERCQCGTEEYETGYCCSGYHQALPCQNSYPEDETGINYLTPEAAWAMDDVTNQYRNRLNYARVGIVYNGTVVYTKSYKDDSVDIPGQWASISKPGTAMITMQLREEGIIDSIDDNIWDYSSKYIDCMPPPWENSPLTIKHLLLHQSGVRYTAPLWSGDYLNLQFEPGTYSFYTSGGFGIVGDVIRAATGKGYDTLVNEYLADPVGAPSITSPDQSDARSETAHSDWQAPGSWVSSTVEDLAKFSAGVMNHKYVSKEVLENEMLFEYTPNMGLGWMVGYENNTLYAGHTGDNGYQKSAIVIDVTNKMSVSILFSDSIDMTEERIPWANAILAELKTFENPIQDPPACPGFCCESLCDDPILGSCSVGTCCAQQSSCAPEDCGNGICDPGDCNLCSLDCDISQCIGDGYCSTGFIDGNENCGNSPDDCSCSSPDLCCNDACIEPSCDQDSDCGSDICKIYTCNDAGSCTASCSSVDITQCIDGDGCCPSGCDSQNDSDCTGFDCNALELLLDMDSSVEDSSINDIICTVIGASHTANGKFGGAFSFDGNDYIDCGTDPNLNINDELTISAWFNPNALSGSTRTLVGKFDSDTDTHGYTLFWQTYRNSLEFDVGDGTGYSRAQLTGYTDLGSWHHVAGVFDGGTLKIYVDGILQNTTTYTDLIADENDPLRVGANSGALNRYWNGVLDEVSVWSRALSQEEIDQLQTQPIPCGQ